MATKRTQPVFGTGSAEAGRVSANGKAAEAIVRRATMKRLKTLSGQGEAAEGIAVHTTI